MARTLSAKENYQFFLKVFYMAIITQKVASNYYLHGCFISTNVSNCKREGRISTGKSIGNSLYNSVSQLELKAAARVIRLSNLLLQFQHT